MSTQTAIATTAPGRVEALQVPVAEPGENEVLIKVEYSTLSPFDVYVVDRGFYAQYPQVIGLNIGGTVVKVGAKVDDMNAGDRAGVVAFSYLPKAKGFQEYSVQPRSNIGKIPDTLALEKATSVPDNLVTAFYTLFNQLALPIPSEFPAKSAPADSEHPILIYGAGATSGQYAIELLRLAGYKNVIAVASKRHEAYLKSLGALHVVDYKSSEFAAEIAAAAGGQDGKVDRVVDCVSLTESFAAIAKVIRKGGSVAFLLPFKYGGSLAGESGELLAEVPDQVTALLPENVNIIGVGTFRYQQDERLADTLMPKILPQLLRDELVQPNRIRLVDDGDLLKRTNDALDLLRNNKVSGEKVVVKISPC